ncbi:hypothetical protein PV08_02260 [Exophiala spinifera]|uniref:Uncharacterized protein n=1 Tax=Exophiala spinifera TaxID=91928 RepID=A0A0D2BTD7_9EURO|nr:uncharacterized protein PV08_02260 [Exophiala spinifera]KIW21680.1 hypothetical protein PV08_02260 [Exophiala spinifera]
MGSPVHSDFIRADTSKIEPSITHTVSNGAVSMSPELFEKLYLTPKVHRAGGNIKRFANPTPLGFIGQVSATPPWWLPAEIFFFVGPVLLILTCIFEWVMGNLFPMMVCGVLAVFWLSFGMLKLPTLNLEAPYTSADSGPAGALSTGFNAVIALYLIVWGFTIFTFLILSIRTNVVFVMIFVSVTVGVFVLSGAYWKAGGAIIFVAGALARYMVIVMMAVEMQYPVFLPVGDLSHCWEKPAGRGFTTDDEV